MGPTTRTSAYHFLRADWRSAAGDEPPWQLGESRTWEGRVKLCEHGYHSSPSWRDALYYAPGPVACRVEVSEPVERDDTPGQVKWVSQSRRLAAAADVSYELRLFGCDCAERALRRERAAGREPAARSWAAVAVARRHASGEAADGELIEAAAAAQAAAEEAMEAAATEAAVWMTAQSATRSAASTDTVAATRAAAAAAQAAAASAAATAAEAAAQAACWAAPQSAELEWQRARLAGLLDGAVGDGEG